MPKEENKIVEAPINSAEEDVELDDSDFGAQNIPTSLNEELSEKIEDNPNKFIGCGG